MRDARIFGTSKRRGTRIAALRRMHALEEGELLINERPTIPVPPPRDSGVRLKVARIPLAAATVDVVVCDLTRDPRSEDYNPLRAQLKKKGLRRRRRSAR